MGEKSLRALRAREAGALGVRKGAGPPGRGQEPGALTDRHGRGRGSGSRPFLALNPGAVVCSAPAPHPPAKFFPTGTTGGGSISICLEEKALGWRVRNGGDFRSLGPGQDIPGGCSLPVNQALDGDLTRPLARAQVPKGTREIRVKRGKGTTEETKQGHRLELKLFIVLSREPYTQESVGQG